MYAGVAEPLVAEDVADAIVWMATRPAHVNIDLLVVKPRVQAAQHKVHRDSTPDPACPASDPQFSRRQSAPSPPPRLPLRALPSGLAAVDLPRGGVAEVALADPGEHEPVVQPVAPAGPELHLVGHDPEPAPEVGHRHVVVPAAVGEGRRPAPRTAPRARRASRSARTAFDAHAEMRDAHGRESKYCSTSSRSTSTAVPRKRIARYIAGQVRDAATADFLVSSRPLVEVRAVTNPGPRSSKKRISTVRTFGRPVAVDGGHRDRQRLEDVAAHLRPRHGVVDPGPRLGVGRLEQGLLGEAVTVVVDARGIAARPDAAAVVAASLILGSYVARRPAAPDRVQNRQGVGWRAS